MTMTVQNQSRAQGTSKMPVKRKAIKGLDLNQRSQRRDSSTCTV